MQSCFGSLSDYCCVIYLDYCTNIFCTVFFWCCTFFAHIQERTKQSFLLVSKCRYQKHQFLDLLLLVKCGKNEFLQDPRLRQRPPPRRAGRRNGGLNKQLPGHPTGGPTTLPPASPPPPVALKLVETSWLYKDSCKEVVVVQLIGFV